MMNQEELDIKMKKSAEIAVKIARDMGKTLNYSEESIQIVEDILNAYHKILSRNMCSRYFDRAASKLKTQTLSRAFGSYVGEVYRINMGGVWIVENGTPGIAVKEQKSFPRARVTSRLLGGPADNVVAFYKEFKKTVKNVEPPETKES